MFKLNHFLSQLERNCLKLNICSLSPTLFPERHIFKFNHLFSLSNFVFRERSMFNFKYRLAMPGRMIGWPSWVFPVLRQIILVFFGGQDGARMISGWVYDDFRMIWDDFWMILDDFRLIYDDFRMISGWFIMIIL